MSASKRAAAQRQSVRAGLYVSVASVVWTTCQSAVSIVVGRSSHSLALVTFGLVGALDAVGSATLIVHFRHALRHDDLSERLERVALRVVSAGLIVVGAYGVGEAIRRLAAGHPAQTSTVAVVTAALSAAVLAALFSWKRKVAAAIPSPALRADAWLSATGAALAVITLVGAAAAATWWRTDPAAAAVVGGGAIVVGVANARTGRVQSS